jgi:hypothetical protein
MEERRRVRLREGGSWKRVGEREEEKEVDGREEAGERLREGG